jgi:hypothetical protein
MRAAKSVRENFPRLMAARAAMVLLARDCWTSAFNGNELNSATKLTDSRYQKIQESRAMSELSAKPFYAQGQSDNTRADEGAGEDQRIS